MHPTSISGSFVVKTKLFTDYRGSFARLFCEQELAPVLAGRRIVQINHSRTNTVGAIRGLHYQQPPHAEIKLVRCLKGKVWDVAVDLRASSPTFLKWHAEELTSENRHMLIIPEGCAHGFQVLVPDSELLYLHTAPYQPGSEGGVAWNDPRLGIDWPLPPVDLSPRDRNHPWLPITYEGIEI